MTWDLALRILETATGFAVLLVAAGIRWGKLESRRKDPVPASGNGSPSLGELSRRFDMFEADRRSVVRSKDLEDRLKLRDDANKREHEELWGAIKDLRAMDATQQRRIDSLMERDR